MLIIHLTSCTPHMLWILSNWIGVTRQPSVTISHTHHITILPNQCLLVVLDVQLSRFNSGIWLDFDVVTCIIMSLRSCLKLVLCMFFFHFSSRLVSTRLVSYFGVSTYSAQLRCLCLYQNSKQTQSPVDDVLSFADTIPHHLYLYHSTYRR